MSEVRVMFDYNHTILSVPSRFIDQYMLGCPPIYVLIYLHSLRRAAVGEALSHSEIAAHFNILESDVHNAWRHWAATGIVSLENDAAALKVVFLPQEKWGSTEEKPTPVVKKAVAIAERPHYTVDELTLFRHNSGEVEQLFSCAERALGKMLTYHDMNVLFGLYDWLRLPMDVLAFLLEYCAAEDKRDLRYIEKCALNWSDKGIDTVAKAQEQVQAFDTDYRAVLQAMGANAGFPTPTQKKYIDKWRKDWGMTTEIILEACDRAAVQIGKPKFTYVDKIIAAWHKAGAVTLAAIEAADKDFVKTREVATTPTRGKAKPSRFANFTQRNNDYSKLEKLEREYMLREMKG